MDQFNNFMSNNNFCSNNEQSNMGGGMNFNDMGFGNQMQCMPVRNSSPEMPMPALPTGNDNMYGMSMNNGNINCSNYMFSFPNESQMDNNNNNNDYGHNMMSQMNNGGGQMTSFNDDAQPSFDNIGFHDVTDEAAAPAFDKTIAPAKSGIKFYSRNDVLCGRGGGTNVHPGNRRFRDLINANRRAYLKARKNDKPAISRSIVRTIREMNGRFLKKDEKLGLWFEIGDDGAREKTSQALRQRAPEMRKILFEDEQRMRNEQLARQQQQAALMQRSFMNNQSMNMNQSSMNQCMNQSMNSNNNFSSNSQMMNMNNNMDGNNFSMNNSNNDGSIHEQYAMLQQKKYFANRDKDVFLKKLAMNGFDSWAYQDRQNKYENMASQTLLSQGLKPVTPRGA
jgi:hypothetical protein